MPKRFRLTRRFPVAMTEDGYRKLKRFAQEAGLDEGEALSFLFENFDSVTHTENLTHRLRLFNSELEDRKQKCRVEREDLGIWAKMKLQGHAASRAWGLANLRAECSASPWAAIGSPACTARTRLTRKD